MKFNKDLKEFLQTLPEIPKTWLVAILLVGMILMRFMGIDSWTTAALSIIIGFLTGVKMEQMRK